MTHNPIARFSANLATRGQLLRAALFKRAIQEDVFAIADRNYMPYRDVPGELDPFDLLGIDPGPDLASIPAPSDFLSSDDPAYFVSEPGVSRFLARLAVRRNSRVIVELGCFVGWTTAHLARAAARLGGESRVWAVELDTVRVLRARENLARQSDGDRVSILAGSSLDPALHAGLPHRFDLVFIDTLHTYDTTIREIDFYGARLNPGGCLVLHDSLSFGGVRRAVAEMGDRYQRCTFATERGNGLTVLLPRIAPS